MEFEKEMRCPFCGARAKLAAHDSHLFNGTLIVKDNPGYKCQKCSEEFLTSEMMDVAIEKAKKEFSFRRQVISTGGSLAITLPTDLSKHYNLRKGSMVRVVPFSKNEIRILTKTTSKVY